MIHQGWIQMFIKNDKKQTIYTLARQRDNVLVDLLDSKSMMGKDKSIFFSALIHQYSILGEIISGLFLILV